LVTEHVSSTSRTRPQGLDLTKPPYRVPSMEEIRALPWNGFTVASTFSGAGGSSTGYRMAGFKVLWANEFIDAARDTYRANCADYTNVDGRDIRSVTPEDILATLGMKPGELDLFDGSPPCASFSTAGKREKGWGEVKKYSDKSQRTDDLFFEYIRLLRGLKPKTFVAENVSGLVKGTAKGYFLEILKELKASGYRVSCRVLDAQWLGVPQARQRTIFVGVRNDLGIEPAHPKPLPYRYSVRDALPWLTATGGIRTTGFAGSELSSSAEPCATIMAGGGGGMNTSQFGCESLIAVMGNSGFLSTRKDPNEPSPTILSAGPCKSSSEIEIMCQSGAFPKHYSPATTPAPAVMAQRTVEMKTATERRKFTIQELKRICAFPDDFILCGTYAQQWERCGRAVPPVMMSHIAATIRDEILAKL
jgi:DNA (cytosine-5)-methyltransferase 1